MLSTEYTNFRQFDSARNGINFERVLNGFLWSARAQNSAGTHVRTSPVCHTEWCNAGEKFLNGRPIFYTGGAAIAHMFRTPTPQSRWDESSHCLAHATCNLKMLDAGKVRRSEVAVSQVKLAMWDEFLLVPPARRTHMHACACTCPSRPGACGIVEQFFVRWPGGSEPAAAMCVKVENAIRPRN